MATLSRSNYDNIIILSHKGVPLATISKRKAKWYLIRNLAAEVPPPPGYPRAIQLNFVAEVESPTYVHDLVVCKDECVFCATPHMLTIHHVVPSVIRKHFPLKDKSRARHWCVLLCFKHHMEIETDLKKIYYHNNDFPNAIKTTNSNLALQKIKSLGHISRVPPEKLERLLSDSDYKIIADIPPYSTASHRQRVMESSQIHKESIRKWALKFVAEHGGVDGTKAFFREHFMSYNPKFLPDGWLEDKELA